MATVSANMQSKEIRGSVHRLAVIALLLVLIMLLTLPGPVEA